LNYVKTDGYKKEIKMKVHKFTLTLLAGSSIAITAQASSVDNNGAPEGVTAAAAVVQAMDATPALFPTETINFEADTSGAKPNGWQSVDSTTVSFTDSNGSDLDVYDYDWQSDGQALAVHTDYDDSHLIMNFSQRVRAVSMDFGNDDPFFSAEGDVAELKVFDGGSMLGASQVVMNRNDIMDQSIAVSDVGCFDSATFKYNVDPAVGLIEIVDNIQLELCGGAVLEAGGKTVCTGGNESEGGGDGNGQYSAINECDGPAGFWSADGYTEYDGFVSAMVVLPDSAETAVTTPGATWEYNGTPTPGSYFKYMQKSPEVTLTCTGTPQDGSTARITDIDATLSGWLYTCVRPDGTVAAEYTVADQHFVNGTGAGKGRNKDRGSTGDGGGTFDLTRGNVTTYQPN
jgi:hypothetical protein